MGLLPEFTNLIVENDQIQVTVADTVVTGRIIYRCRQMLEVEITSPIGGFIVESLNVPAMFVGVYDMLGKYGNEVAGNLLGGTYSLHLYIQSHKEEMHALYEQYKQELDWLQNTSPEAQSRAATIESLKQERKELRKKLKAGEIGNNEHGLRVKAIKRTILEKEHETSSYVFDLYNKLIDPRFEKLPIDKMTWCNVLSFLERAIAE